MVEGLLGHLTVDDVFNMASYVTGKAPSLHIAPIMGVDASPEQKEFSKLAASNRGLTIDFLTDETQTRRWLGIFVKKVFAKSFRWGVHEQRSSKSADFILEEL